MRRHFELALLGAMLLFAVTLPAQNPLEREGWCAPEQTRPLPKPVVRVLMDSKYGAFAKKLIREEGNDPYRTAPLAGVRVHLADEGGPIFLVGGMGPMTGGDNRWFWLVQQTGDTAKILLYVGASCVHFDNRMTKGYRDVEAHWQTAGRGIHWVFRYDGNVYQLHKKTFPE